MVTVIVGGIISPVVIHDRKKRAAFVVFCTLLFSLLLRETTEELKATDVTSASTTLKEHAYAFGYMSRKQEISQILGT